MRGAAAQANCSIKTPQGLRPNTVAQERAVCGFYHLKKHKNTHIKFTLKICHEIELFLFSTHLELIFTSQTSDCLFFLLKCFPEK